MQKVISEHDIQVSLMEWAFWMKIKYPELEYLFAIPNGGARHVVTGLKLKNEGVKRGVPDLFLPVARGKYHGLFVELKRPGGKLSKQQEEWAKNLFYLGYGVVVCFSLEEAINAIEDYLKNNFDKM